MRVLIAAALLAVTGCSAAESAREQALKLQDDAEAYVNDNITVRRQIRTANWTSIQLEAAALDQEGKYAEARALRCELYPPLVTLGTLRREEDPSLLESLRGIDLEIAGCPSPSTQP